MATVVFFDTYPISGLGFKQLLRSARADIDSRVVTSIEELTILAAEQVLDILVLTINAPKTSYPLRLVAQCRSVCPGTKVVLYDEEQFPAQPAKWLKSGASGFRVTCLKARRLLFCCSVLIWSFKVRNIPLRKAGPVF